MATPSTVAAWALNGIKVEFDVPFDYLSRTFVKLTLIGATPKPLVLGTDFEFISTTRVRTFVAYGPPAYQLLEVRRETSTTERLVEFHDASILTASDMNVADLQVLHVAEEARNAATETLGVNNDGHLDARGRRIVNGGDPVDPQDFATKSYIDGNVNGAVQARIDAEAARDAAKGHRDAAVTSATQSAQSASTAGTHANTAKTHRDAAKASQDAAKASQDASKASENASSASAGSSKTSADASKASELKAKDWAEKLPGPVEGAQYSAKYWAQQAANGVIPENSITAIKMPLWNSANVIPDHNFWDLGSSWIAPGGSAESKIVSNPTRGRGLRVDIASATGAAGGFAWDIRGRRFKVYPGRPIHFAALVESGITQGQSVASGEVGIHMEWTDEQGTSLGQTTLLNYFTPGQQMGDVSSWATPPANTVYGHIRVQARHSSAGTWSGFFILYRPQAFMQIPLHQASVSWDSLDNDLQSNRFLRLDTGGTVRGSTLYKAATYFDAPAVMRHAGGASVASQSLNYQSPVTSNGTLVNSWVIGINGGIEVRTLNNNNAGRVARFSDDGGSKRLDVYGNFDASGAVFGGSVTSREHVYGASGRVAYVSEAVLRVNGVGPDLAGNVTVAGGVPLDAYGKVGECMTLAVRCPTILTESTVVINGVGGVQLNRLRLAGNPGSPVLSLGVVPGGSYRLLSVISVVVLDGINVPIWSVQRTG